MVAENDPQKRPISCPYFNGKCRLPTGGSCPTGTYTPEELAQLVEQCGRIVLNPILEVLERDKPTEKPSL